MINKFQGSNRWLSNFWPCLIEFEGMSFPSVEHAYVASKTTALGYRETIQKMTAGEAKRYGRQLKLRPDWEEKKLVFTAGFLLQKFAYGSELGDKLLATGTQMIIEGNTWGDDYWGVCTEHGQNHLGRLIMGVRDILIKKQKEESESCNHLVEAS